MAKKLSEIEKFVNSQALPFRDYLFKSVDSRIMDLLLQMSKHVKVYIFSGVIRNFFLGLSEIRDLDIVIDGNIDLESFLQLYEYKKNSFGGFKITIGITNVDMWFLKNTWALNHEPHLEFHLEKYIPNTAFFNFSSILFSLDEDKFYYTLHFLRFLRDKKIDLVYSPNANNALCVVNSIYYSDKLKLPIGNKLIRHLKKLYKANLEEYDQIQLRHFGKVIYPKQAIKERIEILSVTTKRAS